MNRLNQILGVLFLALGFIACEPEVSFTESQPAELTESTRFKNKFRGKFLCVEDSSVLRIDKTSIVQNWHFELDTKNDSIIDIKNGIGRFGYDSEDKDLQITANEDSTHFVIDYKKIIFELSSSNVLKYDKGIYFLNEKKTGSTWDVKILHFSEHGVLLLKDLDLSKEDLEKLKAITVVEVDKDVDGDITEYKLQPTRKELKEILNAGLFEVGEEFIRIR